MKMNKKEKIRGLKSTYVFIPTIILIASLYIVIMISTVFINTYTEKLATDVKNTSDCITKINYIQSTSSKLSETATSFVHNPTVINIETKSPLIVDGMEILIRDPLDAYLSEKKDEEKDPDYILESVKIYNLSDIVLDLLTKAVNASNNMQKEQSHSIRLLNSISTINIPNDILEGLEPYELTTEELALSDNEKKTVAFENLLKKEYASEKEIISNNLRQITKYISQSSVEEQNETNFSIKWMRGIIWGSFALVLISTFALFFILLKKLVFPIVGFIKKIDKNENLDSEHALYEANKLAIAYNNLLERHKEFEEDLRNVAEFDALTNMPNRYCYNNFLKKTIDKDKSTCVFLFDINNLKYVNDTYGHSKGDELIKNTSLCIKECFLNQEGKNCYRIGGDEFVAILDDISEDEIENLINEFIKKQSDLNVSIAYGYAYSNNVRDIGYEKLIIKADKRMYKKKKEMYKDGNPNETLNELV